MRRSFQPIRLRLMVARGLFLCLFLVVAGRAVHLQLFQGKRLVQMGQRQHLKELTVLPKRGAVFDRAGEPLALSLESSSVYVRPNRIDDIDDVARQLARILELKQSHVRQKLKSGKPFVWIKRQISPQEADRIQALNADGIGMYIEPTRYYPQGQAAGQVLGFVGRDSVGLEGLELQYNQYIRGETGSSITERDALGRRVLVHGVEGIQNPPGGDIHVTLDTTIQHLAERELEAAVTKYRAKAGVAIVVEPFSGQILALANFP